MKVCFMSGSMILLLHQLEYSGLSDDAVKQTNITSEIIPATNIRPKLEEHMGELVYVISNKAYLKNKMIVTFAIIDSSLIDLPDGKYYVVDAQSSSYLCINEFVQFVDQYGTHPTKAQKSKMIFPIALTKFEIKNGRLFGIKGEKRTEIDVGLLCK